MLKSVKLAKKKTEGKEHQAGSNSGQVIATLAVASIFVLGVLWLMAHRSLLGSYINDKFPFTARGESLQGFQWGPN